MYHYKRIQNAVNFIEANLDQSISLKAISKAAFSSLSYFHRIFYFTTGLTVKEYIRKRRLSIAAQQLHCTNLSITDIGLNAGYETLESFTRAFKKSYAASPRAFRQKNQEVSLFDPLDILNDYATRPKPNLGFELKIEHVLYHQVCIAGFQIYTTLENEQQSIDISHFANKILADNTLGKHFNLKLTPIFGVYTNMSDEDEFDYTIGCLASAKLMSTNSMVSHIIAASEYAKFTFQCPDRIKEVWQYIYGFWFPENDHYRAPGFDFEIYREDGVDIYIPINSKTVDKISSFQRHTLLPLTHRQ